MVDIILELLNNFLEDGAKLFDEFLTNDFIDIVLRAENEITAVSLDSVLNFFVVYAIAITVIKFLKKLFFVYVGWNEGDVLDTPSIFIINFIKALAILLSVTSIYDFIVDLTKEISTSLLGTIALNDTLDFQSILEINPLDSIFFVLAVIIFLFLGFLLKLQFIKRGLETLVLRVGFPLACVGLVDSNSGAFEPYFKLFILNSFTTIAQVVTYKLSFVLFKEQHLFWGLATMFMTLNTPKFLQQYMLQVFDTPSLANTVKGIGSTVIKGIQVVKGFG